LNEYASLLVQRHGRAAIFVDTNILLLLVIGTYDRQLITRFKRTMVYAPEDYDLAVRFVGSFGRVVTTPSVLAEVSNLAGQLGSHLRAACFEVFARYIQVLDEREIASATISQTPEFTRFGLTDAAILQISGGSMIVLTDDLRLSVHMEQQCLPVLDFTHLRTPNLFR